MIVDPLDGSLNARRMLPTHSLSFAVATGSTMADVELGYVYDFGAAEEYFARRGRGATLDGRELRAQGPGYGLEVVGIESAKPERTLPLLEALAGKAYRIRAVGSIAISLCYVAGGRFDGMLTGRACRSVDAAAGQLIAREAGAEVVFDGDGLDVSLDLDARYHVAAALDRELLADVLKAQERAEPPPAQVVTASGFVDWGLAERVALGLGRQRRRGPGSSTRRPWTPPTPRRWRWRSTTPACVPTASCRGLSWSIARSGRDSGCARCASSRRSSSARSPTASRSPARSGASPARWRAPRRAPRPGSRSATRPARCSASTTSRWWATERPPRLVFVGTNLAAAHEELGEDPGLFLRWIALHESTHSIQFASVPWLRPHLGELLEELIGGASSRLDPAPSGGWRGGSSAATPAPRFAPSCAATSPACSRGPSRGAPWIASRRRCP